LTGEIGGKKMSGDIRVSGGPSMADLVRKMIDEVTAAARRIHGRYSSRSAYRTALIAELRANRLPVEMDLTFPENYGDVEVFHCLDLLLGSRLAVEVRSAEEVLPNHDYASLLELYLRKAGLGHGLVVDFAEQELKIIPVSLSAGHRFTG
jgi:GxxExxY protein